MSSRIVIYYKLCYGINHLKAYIIEYIINFQEQKNNRFEGQNMGGGIKDMLSPPCQNMGGIYHPHPPRIYALGKGVNPCSNMGGYTSLVARGVRGYAPLPREKNLNVAIWCVNFVYIWIRFLL